jgi:aspartate/methionine/tyrosine aminotransferase
MSDASARPTEVEAASAAVPLDRDAVRAVLDRQPFDVRRASIREMNRLVNAIEEAFGLRFVRMEFGIPGLPVHPIAIEAEHAALRDRHVGHVYAPFDGVPVLKREAARFVRLFMGLDVPPESCIPTVGAMQGCFASLLLASQLEAGRRTVLLLAPGFPVNLLQLRILGLESARIDFYDHRGERLLRAVEERVARGDVAAMLWSSPNNPSWICLTDGELAGLARIAEAHRVLAIEDLAYFGMDTREDYLVPGRPPYQPTILRHTSRAISILSSSKMFSYAGQRVAIALLPPELMSARCPDLAPRLGSAILGHAFLHGTLYPVTASVPESTQYGLAALLRAASDGDRSLFAPAREYARRAALLKPMFLDAGFRLVYDRDLDRPLADGFYFTIAHPRFAHGADLLIELLHYGVSAITLETTGSSRIEGLRACVSLIGDEEMTVLRERLERFRADHPS